MDPEYPEYIETTTLRDTERKFTYEVTSAPYRPSTTYTSTITPGTSGYYNPYRYSYEGAITAEWELSLEEPDIRLEEYRVEKTNALARRSVCDKDKDLNPDRIFKTISIMKSKLMVACAPYHVDHIKCKMTPTVKNNLIKAYRKLNMFGKKTPFVARFDEYGRRLPDDVQIDTLRGMDIELVNPADYGEFYISFEAVESSYIIADDIPF